MKKVVLFLLFIVLGMGANAQFNLNKLTFGGGVGLQFGDYTLVNIAPQVGYNFSNYFNAGAGFTYTYYKEDYSHYKQTNSYFGFNVYGKFYPIPYMVLMVQPEINRMWKTNEDTRTGTQVKNEKMIPTCLVGAGLRLGALSVMLKYDLAQNDNSPYGNRIFYSIGYTFSL